MTDLHEKFAEIRDDIKPEWDDDDTERALANVPKRRAQRRRRKQIGGALALIAVVGVAGLVAINTPTGSISAPNQIDMVAELPTGVVGQPTSSAFALRDGSNVAPGPNSTVTLVESTQGADRVELEDGAATFTISAAPNRRVYVLAGKVQFEAERTTTFEVRKSSDYVEVFVVNGSVLVTTQGEQVTLEKGARKQFPLEDSDVGAVPIVFAPDSVAEAVEVAEAEIDAKTEPTPAAAADRDIDIERPAQDEWERLAQEREWKAAARALDDAEPDTIEQLLLAADVRRYAGQPIKALPYLQEVAAEHRGDSRAAMAQFQKGRILMNAGQHADAAAAFASVRKMPANGAVAEDALSREVEAWFRSGDRDKARNRAESYLEAYPDGYRAKVVRRYGGITSP